MNVDGITLVVAGLLLLNLVQTLVLAGALLTRPAYAATIEAIHALAELALVRDGREPRAAPRLSASSPAPGPSEPGKSDNADPADPAAG